MNLLPELHKASFAEQIAESLRKEILAGNLKPGDKLPSERELAAQLGTNRNTLREAIRYLEGLKLVSVRQGAGVTVRDYRTECDMAIVPFFIIEGKDANEKSSVIADILSLRRTILSQAAAVAARKSQSEDIEAMRAQLKRIEEKLPEGDIAEIDLEFYHLLVIASHSLISRWMYNTFMNVYVQALPIVKALWVTPPNYLKNMSEFIDLIERRQAGQAADWIVKHLSRGDEIVVNSLTVR